MRQTRNSGDVKAGLRERGVHAVVRLTRQESRGTCFRALRESLSYPVISYSLVFECSCRTNVVLTQPQQRCCKDQPADGDGSLHEKTVDALAKTTAKDGDLG